MWGYWNGLGTIVILKVRVFSIMGIPIWLKPWLPNRDGVGRWSKIILLPFFCYFPAYLLVHSSFKSFEALTSKKAEQSSDSATLEQKVAELEKQVGIKINPTKNSMIDRVNSLSAQIAIKGGVSNVQAYAVSKEYTVGLIEKEAKEQADKAASDAVDKAKSELISQISFPVLFAIASIFAAFAVKDILTEILKDQEKGRIKEELINEVKSEIPRAIENSNFSESLQSNEACNSWLEHELIMDSIYSIISEIQSHTIKSEPALEKSMVDAALKLLDRSDPILTKAFVDLKEERILLLRKAKYQALLATVDRNDIKVIGSLRSQISQRLDEIANPTLHLDPPLVERPYERKENLYEIQKASYFNLLGRIKLSGFSNLDIDLIIRTLKKEEKNLIESSKQIRKSDLEFYKTNSPPKF